jgi:hypothetical protein
MHEKRCVVLEYDPSGVPVTHAYTLSSESSYHASRSPSRDMNVDQPGAAHQEQAAGHQNGAAPGANLASHPLQGLEEEGEAEQRQLQQQTAALTLQDGAAAGSDAAAVLLAEIASLKEQHQQLVAQVASANEREANERRKRLSVVVRQLPNFSGEKEGQEWDAWQKAFVARMHLLRIDPYEWFALASNMLEKQAMDFFLSNESSIDTWEGLCELMASGPFGKRTTDYSTRAQLVSRKLAAGSSAGVTGMIRKVEELFAKAPTKLPDAERIFYVQFNLPDFLRDAVILNNDNQPWSSYTDFRTALMVRANALTQAGQGQDKKRGPGSEWQQQTGKKFKKTTSTKTNADGSAPGPSKGPGKQGAPPVKAKKCTACGQQGHWATDRSSDGKPVCPRYDASKDKGKKPSFGKPRA